MLVKIKNDLLALYRQYKTDLARTEKRLLQVPIQEFKEEAKRQEGILEGIKIALTTIETHGSSGELPLNGGNR